MDKSCKCKGDCGEACKCKSQKENKKGERKMISKKVFNLILVAGFVFCAYSPVFAETIEDEIAGLKSRIAKLEREKDQQGGGVLRGRSDRIRISGVVEVEASYEEYKEKSAENNTDSNDIDLANVELGIDVDIAKYAGGHLLLKYEGDDVFVDEGTINLGGVEDIPFYLTAGKFCVPFGMFNSHFISDPITLEIGEINEGAGVLGYANDYFDVALGVFNGDVDETGSDDVIEGFVASAIFTPPLSFDDSEISFGVSYTSTIAEAGGLEDKFTAIEDYVGALSAFLSANYKNFTFEAEYVGALDKFQADELITERESQPMACNFELAYAVNDKIEIAGRYEFSDELWDLLPEGQYGPVISYLLFENTTLAVEYLHGEYKNGDTRDLVTAQLAIEF